VAVNCAALPEALLESELFGHEHGAFTGAIARRIGKFELAHRGMLLLDEVAEMATSLQVKLLRVLQEGEIDRIGGNAPIEVDVRIVATTNRDIKEEIEKGRFRNDLFYRLCVVPIKVPPLRDRQGDIPLLVDHFLVNFSRQMSKPSLSISEGAKDALQSYTWPGNVRELENVVERAVMLCRGDVLSAQDFFPENLPIEPVNPIQRFAGATLHDAEKYLIMSTLERVNGNKTRAAEILGITARTIRNKLRQYTSEDDSL
jgi:transcriptional regulator with GAF, ATPase, and Fis domain